MVNKGVNKAVLLKIKNKNKKTRKEATSEIDMQETSNTWTKSMLYCCFFISNILSSRMWKSDTRYGVLCGRTTQRSSKSTTSVWRIKLEHSLEVKMTKLRLVYFGHIMRRLNLSSSEKKLKTAGKKKDFV